MSKIINKLKDIKNKTKKLSKKEIQEKISDLISDLIKIDPNYYPGFEVFRRDEVFKNKNGEEYFINPDGKLEKMDELEDLVFDDFDPEGYFPAERKALKIKKDDENVEDPMMEVNNEDIYDERPIKAKDYYKARHATKTFQEKGANTAIKVFYYFSLLIS